MPELPDLVYIRKFLEQTLPGQKIACVSVKQPIVLRVLLDTNFQDFLTSAEFQEIFMKGPFLGFKFAGNKELIIHPMLTGKFKYSDSDKKTGRGLCFTLALDSGNYLHYLDEKKMGKVYALEQSQLEKIPRFLQQGQDILSPDFTVDKFKQLIKGQRKQVRVFLMDQTKLSAIGNAYADEILFDAGIHPKILCSQLARDSIETLYKSINSVISWGIDSVQKSGQPIEVKVRDHVRVRNRKNQQCPRCGALIRCAGVLGFDAFFCPTCQPTSRKQFINWN